jgi:hypothetical protein
LLQLQQGSSVLLAITSNVVGNKLLSKTLDMEGRTQAVQLMQNMAEGFNNINIPDPNKLKPFMESVTASVMAILYVSEYYGSHHLVKKRLAESLLTKTIFVQHHVWSMNICASCLWLADIVAKDIWLMDIWPT